MTKLRIPMTPAPRRSTTKEKKMHPSTKDVTDRATDLVLEFTEDGIPPDEATYCALRVLVAEAEQQHPEWASYTVDLPAVEPAVV